MKRFRPLLILLCLLGQSGHGFAQNPATPAAAAGQDEAPQRSVAVIVDVSGSLKKKFDLTQEARDIVLDLVSGRGFRGGNGWICEYDEAGGFSDNNWPVDPILKNLYAPYWSGGSGLKALTSAGKIAYFKRFGSLKTTMKDPDLLNIPGLQEFEDALRQAYPKSPGEFNDGHTCYYIAVSRVADFLLPLREDGCYLFVISDELDDPDKTDVMDVLESHGIYDINYIRKMRQRFEELKREERFHFVSRFRKGDRKAASTGGQGYVRLSWYAIGEKPKAVEPPPPEPVRKPEDPPPPPKPQPPSFARSLTLLGGLIPANDPKDSAKPDVSRIKGFDHPEPFIAWQVDGNATGVDSQFEVVIHRLEDTGALQTVQRLKSVQLARTSDGRLRGLPAGTATQPLANGVYRVTIEEKPPTANSTVAVLDPVATWIEVKTPFNWLPWVLTASILSAAGVIGYSVWSLRR
jgi:hypothetical protein